MLLYERIAYEDYLKNCKSEQLDILLQGRESSLKQFARSQHVDEKEVIRQVRLHAPREQQMNYGNKHFLEKSIFPVLEKLFKDYKVKFSEYRVSCGAEILERESLRVKRGKEPNIDAIIIDKDNDVIAELQIQEINEEIGKLIEGELHYLRSFRDDAIIRVGLFLVGYKMPICYMSFTDIDRADKVEALNHSLDPEINQNEVVELSRVYGCGNLPKNTISFLVGASMKYLRHYKYIITAVNINLGFTGLSILVSGFVPYAIRPVTYSYSASGFYTARRKHIRSVYHSPNKMPPNILYVREIAFSGRSERMYCKLVEIKENSECCLVESALEHEISEIRTELEKIWDEKTRYHGTDLINLRPSKGQCGVSSLHLARKLDQQGYKTLFCEGDVSFGKKPNASITNHCWVLLSDYRHRGKNVIIDLTADQNGYSQKIIFKTIDELEKQDIEYIARSEKHPDDIDVEHLMTRLDYLEKELQEKEEIIKTEEN